MIVKAARVIYEDDSNKTLEFFSKYIENNVESGNFKIECMVNELLEVPKKRIEIYIGSSYSKATGHL